MLSQDALAQLSALKKEIRANKNLAKGIVRGTSGRYGFVTLEDDGRDVFLRPNQMDRVFHGDRVEVSVTQNDKGQYEGSLERLLETSLRMLSGRYHIKGKGHFIVYEHQLYKRWIFVPPKFRAQCKEDDYATARITQHPFHNGKAQAQITQNLGAEVNVDIARKYACGIHQLYDHWPKDVLEQARKLQQQPIHLSTETQRRDCRAMPLLR